MAEYSSILLENAVEALAKLPGIGKKTAERIVLELKDKIKVSEDDMLGSGSVSAEDIVSDGAFPARDEAVAALVALGYNSAIAMKAVRKVLSSNPDAANDTEVLLKQALKEML